MKLVMTMMCLGLLSVVGIGQSAVAQENVISKFTVTLGDQEQSFSVQGMNAREVNLACKDYVSKNVRDVFGKIETKSQKSNRAVIRQGQEWWKNRNEICSVVAESTIELGLPLGTPWTHLVQGLLQNSYEFVFYSNNKEEIRRQCQNFLNNRSSHGPFDKANFSYNFKKLKYVRTSSWWSEADSEFCQMIVDSLED